MQREDVRWKPHPRCSKPHALWSAPDKDATEAEVTAFVAAFVRLLKPTVVVETGTYQGHTTAAIAAALSDNGVGRVVTFETDTTRALAAQDALARWFDTVTVVNTAITARSCPQGVEFAFLDSCMACRAADIQVVWPKLVPGGMVLIHDASPLRPPGQVRPPGRYAMLDVATPRGLTVFQKPWKP